MKKINLIERIIMWIEKIPQLFCGHKDIDLMVGSDDLVKGYCMYRGLCDKCGKDFFIYVDREKELFNHSTQVK